MGPGVSVINRCIRKAGQAKEGLGLSPPYTLMVVDLVFDRTLLAGEFWNA